MCIPTEQIYVFPIGMRHTNIEGKNVSGYNKYLAISETGSHVTAFIKINQNNTDTMCKLSRTLHRQVGKDFNVSMQTAHTSCITTLP